MEPAIARSRSNDHRAGARPLTRARFNVKASHQRLSCAARLCHLIWDRHLSPEFLRLMTGARHQRNTAGFLLKSRDSFRSCLMLLLDRQMRKSRTTTERPSDAA